MIKAVSKLIFYGSICVITHLTLHNYAFASEHLTFFGGRSNTNDLLDIVRFRFGSFETYNILGLQYNKTLIGPYKYADFEWAGQVVKHLEKWSLFELDALIAFRWKWFPWNHWIQTSLALGEGISYVTGYPSSETVSQNIYSKYLNYLWVDLRVGLPSHPKWKIDFIIHHRSGGYGLINGVSGGSNYLCLGITRELL